MNEKDLLDLLNDTDKSLADSAERYFSLRRSIASSNSIDVFVANTKAAQAAPILAIAALWLAEGALQAAGAQIFNKLFGRDTSSDISIEDIAELIRKSLEGVARIVDGIVSEHILNEAHRQALAQLSAIRMEFGGYLDTMQEDMLINASSKAIDLIANLESLNLRASQAYLVCVSLYAVIWQERIALYGDTGKIHLRHMLDHAIEHAQQLLTNWENWHQSRFKLEDRPGFNFLGGRRPRCQLIVDGKTLLQYFIDIGADTTTDGTFPNSGGNFVAPNCGDDWNPSLNFGPMLGFFTPPCGNMSDHDRYCFLETWKGRFHEPLEKEHLLPIRNVVGKWEQLRESLQ